MSFEGSDFAYGLERLYKFWTANQSAVELVAAPAKGRLIVKRIVHSATESGGGSAGDFALTDGTNVLIAFNIGSDAPFEVELDLELPNKTPLELGSTVAGTSPRHDMYIEYINKRG